MANDLFSWLRFLTGAKGTEAGPNDILTEVLLAHPYPRMRPSISMDGVGAVDSPRRVAIARRLLDAYHYALEDEASSSLTREGEDVWTKILRDELPEIMRVIDERNAEDLAAALMKFGSGFVWFGGVTTSVDGFNRNLDRDAVALTYFDRLICLAESLGIIRVENPESGPWGENLNLDINEIVSLIEKEIGIDISPPLGAIHTDGLKTDRGVFHYRHITGLYGALQVRNLVGASEAVVEFGGGLGITALYARRMGIKNYTLYDLPITLVFAGHYLLNALGEDAVSLFGEPSAENSIKLLPFWRCGDEKDKSCGLTVNQDSFPEIADNLVYEYLTQIKRFTKGRLLSINQESFYPRTVNNFVKTSGGFRRVYRSKSWIRQGYVDEVYDVI